MILKSNLLAFFSPTSLVEQINNSYTLTNHTVQTTGGPDSNHWIRGTGASSTLGVNHSGPMTWFGWVKGTSDGDDTINIVWNAAGGANRLWSNTTLLYGSSPTINFGNTYADWVFVVISHTAGTNNTLAYKNGVYLSSVTIANPGFTGLRFGGSGFQPTGFAKFGFLDYAVNTDEALELYNNGSGMSLSDFSVPSNNIDASLKSPFSNSVFQSQVFKTLI